MAGLCVLELPGRELSNFLFIPQMKECDRRMFFDVSNAESSSDSGTEVSDVFDDKVFLNDSSAGDFAKLEEELKRVRDIRRDP